MRKLYTMFIAVFFVVSLVAASMMIPVNEKAEENSRTEISPVIEETVAGELDLTAATNGLERVDFIHYKKGYAKPIEAGAKTPSCYKFLSGAKPRWKSFPVSYVINPSNPQGLGEAFVTSAISTSAETWDDATSIELFNNAYTVNYSAVYRVQNYKNEMSFGNYPTSGVIAVTSIWWNPATNAIVEFDILYDTDWLWGDADINSSLMDLQNIATHEIGHGVGLGDIYSTACSEVTMYGYSSYGEIQKRTLEQPDITGLQKIYRA